jgi:hypothetical protein
MEIIKEFILFKVFYFRYLKLYFFVLSPDFKNVIASFILGTSISAIPLIFSESLKKYLLIDLQTIITNFTHYNTPKK